MCIVVIFISLFYLPFHVLFLFLFLFFFCLFFLFFSVMLTLSFPSSPFDVIVCNVPGLLAQPVRLVPLDSCRDSVPARPVCAHCAKGLRRAGIGAHLCRAGRPHHCRRCGAGQLEQTGAGERARVAAALGGCCLTALIFFIISLLYLL